MPQLRQDSRDPQVIERERSRSGPENESRDGLAFPLTQRLMPTRRMVNAQEYVSEKRRRIDSFLMCT